MKTRRPEANWAVAAATAALWLLTAATPLLAIDLPGVMALLAQRKTGEARFTEERFVSSIDGPLRSSGKLTFTAPDRFSRITLEPRPETMEVQGNDLVLKRGSRTRQLALDTIPELAALVDALRGTLSGDSAALSKHFRTAVGGTAAKWVLTLTPLDSRLAARVQTLELVGQGGDLRSIDLRLAGGDRSLMLIDPPAAAR